MTLPHGEAMMRLAHQPVAIWAVVLVASWATVASTGLARHGDVLPASAQWPQPSEDASGSILAAESENEEGDDGACLMQQHELQGAPDAVLQGTSTNQRLRRTATVAALGTFPPDVSGLETQRVGGAHAPLMGSGWVRSLQSGVGAQMVSLLEVEHDAYGPASTSGVQVLYVVYSGSQFYKTRVKWVMDTWGGLVPPGQLLVVGDEPQDLEGVRLVATNCTANSHWEGVCCKYARAVIHAREAMLQDPSLEWAYFIDDDAYVRSESMSKALAGFPRGSEQPIVAAIMGCQATTGGCVGICGGGGFAASRKAIELAVGQDPESMVEEQQRFCRQECENWADIALTQVFKTRHLSLQPLAGLYMSKLRKAEFEHSLVDDHEPLVYHYIQSQSQFQMLHALFTSNRNATSEPCEGCCVTFQNVTQCSSSASPTDTPWLEGPPNVLALWQRIFEAHD